MRISVKDIHCHQIDSLRLFSSLKHDNIGKKPYIILTSTLIDSNLFLRNIETNLLSNCHLMNETRRPNRTLHFV